MSKKEFNEFDIDCLVMFILCIIAMIVLSITAIKSKADELEAESQNQIVYESEYVFHQDGTKEFEEEVIPFEETYLGQFHITVYTPTESHWGYKTATGVESKHLVTCAVDPSIIPYGTHLKIGDYEFIAVDCGNFSGKLIDIFYDGTESEGIEWLSTHLNEIERVWILRE